MFKSVLDEASYLQKVCYLNKKYRMENVFPKQYEECSALSRKVMGITDEDQYYS